MVTATDGETGDQGIVLCLTRAEAMNLSVGRIFTGRVQAAVY
jgi:hypothetical protein